MPNPIAPAVLGTVLVASLALPRAEAQAAPASPALPDTAHTEDAVSPAAGAEHETDGAGGANADDAPATPTTPSGSDSATSDGSADSSQAPIAIVRGGARIAFETLNAAVQAAQTGDVVEVAGDIAIAEPVVLDAGRAITLRATGAATISRAAGFPLEGGKTAGMFRLLGSSSLTLEAVGPASGRLALDGGDVDSNEAVVAIREQSTFTMREGTAIEGALCSWKPWASVYVHGGTFVLDGGELLDGFAMRNAAVAVERGAAFEMRAGAIRGMRTSYSESIVWTRGTVRMTGGVIAGNSSNVSSDGVVHVLDGGTLSFTGGTIGDNAPNNTFGVRVDVGGSLELGKAARFDGADRINLAQGGSLRFADAPEKHTADDPIEVVLSGTWDPGTLLASSPSPEVARDTLPRLSVRTSGTPEKIASVGIDESDARNLALAPSDVTALFDVLDNPFADRLGLTMREELDEQGAFDRLREAVEAHFGGIDTPEHRLRLQQIEQAERYAAYLAEHGDVLEDSVRELSQLGDPGVEARRTQQGYQFDNLDATGLYLKPGEVRRITVYVDAEDPSKLSVAWRQVGVTDTNNYPSLNLEQQSRLVNGANQITVDLTGKTYGSMLYLRNDSTDNKARVRIESADAPDAGGEPVLGTGLGAHPFYEHDAAHPERFWDYVQQVRAHAARAQAGEAADMTLIQMGDEGHAQFAVSATAMAKAYVDIASEADAVAYIEKSNRAIQDRLEFYWAFDGFDAGEATGPNAITTARVHTAFTRTVSSPSTMYAYGRYFHMPESSAATFLSGESMYGWGMSHEYGHMLDNNVIAVAEETNNLYSIAGARHGGIEAARAAGTAFNPSAHYHVNAMNATKRRDAELAQMATDPQYVPDWMSGGDWGTYIWTHVTTWWNGLHFFDDWDYSGYDFSASPYSEKTAADVERYGAYGATLRILRGDPAAVKTIEDLASNASTGVKYNRMAVAFTMGTGYNFAEYLYELGERDLAPQVLEWCSRYPSMPRKVRYFSLNTDAAIVNGAKTYEEIVGAGGAVEPELEVAIVGNALCVTASMPSDELARATTAWELYRDGELAGFSRDGVFELTGDVGDGDPASFSVVAYDVRLNPSTEFTGDGGGTGDDQPGDGSEDGDGSGGADEKPGGGDTGDGDAGDGDSGSGGDADGGDAGDGDTDGGDAGDGDQPGGEGGTEGPEDGSDGDTDQEPGGGTDDGEPDEGGDPGEQPGGGDGEPGGGDTGEEPGNGAEEEQPDGGDGGGSGESKPEDGDGSGDSNAPEDGGPDGDDGNDSEDGEDAGGSNGGQGSEENGPAAGNPNQGGDGSAGGGGNDPSDGGAASGDIGQQPGTPQGGSTASTGDSDKTLAKTGDASLLAPLVAAVGGVLSLAGAAIASKYGKRQ
ncbi:M60 family metallopeptidase [Collinsella ihumii]|uniref:M60 family metallopeptidase n=1 Tax=Collinsella ihumii TaxID=1720204 RepID=UPI0025AA8DB3|nr:M60 family metallopeptidase [Collinsella ihumii]MDN0054548.1 M60 family metallopeptidase [Collinsella ihumii]